MTHSKSRRSNPLLSSKPYSLEVLDSISVMDTKNDNLDNKIGFCKG